MATIEVNDTTLHYERSGSGPAMLFVHGMCGDARVWEDQGRRFEDGRTVVRYDRRGHSRSAPAPTAPTTSVHADDTAALIEALDLAPCLLVGSSGGAAVSTDVARRHGHLLSGVVLSEPPLFGLDPTARDEAMKDLVPIVEQADASGDLDAFVDEFFMLMCPGLWAIIDESVKDRYRANGAVGLAELHVPPLAITTADLEAVTVPTLVLAGDRSHPALRTVAKLMASVLPDVRFVELAECGHVTYAEQPEAFATAVATFAAELDRRAETTTA